MPTAESDGPPSGPDAILMYHCVGRRYPNGEILTAAEFRRHLDYLTTNSAVVDLEQLVTSDDPKRRVSLTFDAGYEDFYHEIVPILREYDAPATVFVIPRLLGRSNRSTPSGYESTLWQEWFDFMTADELRELVDERLVTIGNKSLTHRSILPAVHDSETLREEVIDGKRWLEETLDTAVDSFCYASGRTDPQSVAVVRESHRFAVATDERFVDDARSRYLLPRFSADLIDAETLSQRLTRRHVRRRAAMRLFERLLGSDYPDADERLREREAPVPFPTER